jgi:hypothetical protein
MLWGAVLPQAQAEGPHFRAYTIRVPENPQLVHPDATPALIMGMFAMGPQSVTAPPNDSWPCFAPNAPCSSDPSGGMLIGVPQEVWPLTSCNGASCAQIYWTFTTTTATGTGIVSIVGKQGTSTVLSVSGNVGSIPANVIEVIILDGAGFGSGFCTKGTCATPVAGTVTLTATTKVGSSSVKGSLKITLQ